MEKYNNWKLKFYTIWAGQAVSLITSAILQMAIIFYLTEKTGSAIVLSMASLVGFLPYAVFGPAIGVLVDRHDRKKIMIGADLIIAAAGAVLAIVALYMELPIWMVMVVLFIRSIGTAFHTPALNAVTPLLVPEEQLTKCAGYSQSLQSISYIVSPAVAALLYSVWELNAIIAIDVLGAVIASITVAIVRIPKLGDQVQSLKPNFIREMKEGMAVLRQNKGLFALLLVGTLYMFVYMPINALYPLNGKGTIVIEPDDTKLHQLALNSGYVEKALRYLHALQLMVLIIRPAALAAAPQFTKEELDELADRFTSSDSIYLSDILKAIMRNTTLEPLYVILSETNHLLEWGHHFAYYPSKKHTLSHLNKQVILALQQLREGKCATSSSI